MDKNMETLKGKNIYIEEHRSIEMQEIRKELIKYRNKIRAQSHRVLFKIQQINNPWIQLSRETIECNGNSN